MTDTTDLLDAPAAGTSGDASAEQSATKPARKRSAGLSGMVLAELQGLAGELGISGTARMRKGQLIEAIKERQARRLPAPPPQPRQPAAAAAAAEAPAPAASSAATATPDRRDAGRASDRRAASAPPAPATGPSARPPAGARRRAAGRPPAERPPAERPAADRPAAARPRSRATASSATASRATAAAAASAPAGRPGRSRATARAAGQGDQGARDDDDFDGGGGRSRRRGRYRDRNRDRRGGRDGFAPSDDEALPEISEDDVLVPVAGILDILDNYAFVRTSGYLPGPNDVYVSLAQVRKNGLRKGDAVTGAVRQPQRGRAPGEVQRAGPARHGQRRRPGAGRATGSSSAS